MFIIRLNEPVLLSIIDVPSHSRINELRKIKLHFRRNNNGEIKDIWSFDGKTRFTEDDAWNDYAKDQRCIIISVSLVTEVSHNRHQTFVDSRTSANSVKTNPIQIRANHS